MVCSSGCYVHVYVCVVCCIIYTCRVLKCLRLQCARFFFRGRSTRLRLGRSTCLRTARQFVNRRPPQPDLNRRPPAGQAGPLTTGATNIEF